MKKIWTDYNEDYCNRTILFQITLEGLTAPTVKIAAQNVFRIFAFDRFIAFGPTRAAHGYTRVDCYDLLEFIRDKKLVLTVEVVANYVDNYFTANELPFFCAEIFDGETLKADAGDFTAYSDNCRVVKTQRYSFQRHFSECYNGYEKRKNFYFGECTGFEILQTKSVAGNKLIERAVNYVNYSDAEAIKTGSGKVSVAPIEKKTFSVAIDNIGEQIKGYTYDDLSEYLSDEAAAFNYEECHGGEWLNKGYCTYDFRENLTGFIGLELEVSEPACVYVIWDEILLEDSQIDFFRMETCNVIKWRLEKGQHKLLSFEPYTMRYLRVIAVSGSVKPQRVFLKRFENPNADRLLFSCADKDYELIYGAARNTFAQNAVDLLTDCPSRERSGWLCDSYFSGQSEKLFTGYNKVEYSFLQNYLMAPQDKYLPEGMIAKCYPSDDSRGEFIPNWALWFVLELESYYNRSGDQKLIEDCREKVMGIVAYFERFENEYGLLENLESWIFIEWSKCNDFVGGVNFPSNMLYYRSLIAVNRLYGAPDLVKKAEKIKEQIQKLSYNGHFFTDQMVRVDGVLKNTENTTETCQYYAFYFGIADRKTYAELFETMIHHFGAKRDTEKVYPKVYKSNALNGNYLRLDYLCCCDMAPEAIAECRDYFLFMAKRTHTLWEHDSTFASCNHGFASYAVNILVQGLTGYVKSEGNKVYFSKRFLGTDCNISIPIRENAIVVSVKGGKRSIKVPDGMELVM